MDGDFFLNPGPPCEPSSQPPWNPIADGVSRQNWDKSDQFSQFQSGMNPIASSPVSTVSCSTVSNNIVAARQLAGEFSPAPPYITTTTPLNLPIIDHLVKENLPRIRNSMPMNPNLPFFPPDPGFAERAAKFSCFGSRSFTDRTDQLGLISNKTEVPVGSSVSPVTCAGKFHRVSSSPVLKVDQLLVGFEEIKSSEGLNMKLNRVSGSVSNSNEGSSVSQQIPSGELGFRDQKDLNCRKRKGGSLKGVGSNTKKEEDDIDESKRSKKTEQENDGKMAKTKATPEPPKDYVHVRARRGQATDSHSLAERVRREKISERMKLLQNLVPNCNKVTGKALMLDEIINYVQSLQRQVEFLSMKLATLNPSFDLDTNNLISNVNQSTQYFSQQTSTVYQQDVFDGCTQMTRPVHEFAEPFPHFQGFGQDDLQSIVRMGFGENLDVDTSFFVPTSDQPSNMKIKL